MLRREFAGIDLTLHQAVLPDQLRKIGWLSPMTSARVLIPDLVPGERCLYIDTDSVCLADLTPTYELDLRGRPLAAVVDDYDEPDRTVVFRGFWRVPLDQVPASGWPARPLPPLFCPAFMVMDLERWRRDRFRERYFEWLLAHQEIVRLPNLSALNNIVRGDFLELPHSVHASTLCHGDDARTLDPAAVLSIHYAGESKPWNSNPPGMTRLWQVWEQAGASLRAVE